MLHQQQQQWLKSLSSDGTAVKERSRLDGRKDRRRKVEESLPLLRDLVRCFAAKPSLSLVAGYQIPACPFKKREGYQSLVGHYKESLQLEFSTTYSSLPGQKCEMEGPATGVA